MEADIESKKEIGKEMPCVTNIRLHPTSHHRFILLSLISFLSLRWWWSDDDGKGNLVLEVVQPVFQCHNPFSQVVHSRAVRHGMSSPSHVVKRREVNGVSGELIPPLSLTTRSLPISSPPAPTEGRWDRWWWVGVTSSGNEWCKVRYEGYPGTVEYVEGRMTGHQ